MKAEPATAFVGPLTFVVTSTVVAAIAGVGEATAAIDMARLIDAMRAKSRRPRGRRVAPLRRRQVLCLMWLSTLKVRIFRRV